MNIDREDLLILEEGLLSWAQDLGWRLERTGPLRRGIWPIERLEFLREGVMSPDSWDSTLASCERFSSYVPQRREALTTFGVPVKFYQVSQEAWGFAQIAHTGPADFVALCRAQSGWDALPAITEEVAFQKIGLLPIPPALRRVESLPWRVSGVADA